jgi:hypothetical protein
MPWPTAPADRRTVRSFSSLEVSYGRQPDLPGPARCLSQSRVLSQPRCPGAIRWTLRLPASPKQLAEHRLGRSTGFGLLRALPFCLPTCSMSIGGLICSRSNRIRWHSSVDGALSSSQPVTCPVHIAARRSPARRVMPVILMSSGHWDSIPLANDHPSLWHLYPKVLNAVNVAIVGKTLRNVSNAG